MSFIVSKNPFKYLLLAFLVPSASTALTIKNTFPYTFLKPHFFDAHLTSDENISWTEYLLDNDSPIQKAHKAISSWIEKNGKCPVWFAMPSKPNVLIKMDKDIFRNPLASEIFFRERKLGKKSKFERLSEVLYSKSENLDLYVLFMELQCKGGGLKLYWRDSTKEGVTSMFGNVKNAWYDSYLLGLSQKR